MKKILQTSIIIGLCLLSQNVFAGLTLGTSIPVIGTTSGLPANIGNAGDVTFSWSGSNFVLDADEPYVNASTDNSGNNATFSGSFWLENVGWATFSFGDETNRAKLQTIDSTKLLMKGFAWSENAGWIAFDWNAGNIGTADDGSVYYDKNTRTLKGYAWNDNIGFIPMNGVQFDVVGPVLSAALSKPFEANHAKVINITGSSTLGDVLTINIDKWDASSLNVSNGGNHDFRKAKDYNYIITDESGNQLSGIFDVVANKPSTSIDNSHKIDAGAIATTYTPDMSGTKIADGKATHGFNIKLRDTYGNEVKSVAGIKDVRVNITFANDVDRNQISNFNSIVGNAIIYNKTPNNFGLTYGMDSNIGVGSTTDGIYDLTIASQAPTTEGYSQTTLNNNISISDLSYTVTASGSNSNVGEISTTQINSSYIPRNDLKFTPAIYVSNATNSDNWTIIQGNETETTYKVEENKTTGSDNMTNIKVANVLDLGSNALMSFQNLSIDANDHCYGYNSNVYMTGGLGDCSGYNPNSVLINKLPDFVTFGPQPSIPRTLKSTPKIILISPSRLDYDYKTSIMYDLGTTSGIAYNSYVKNVSGGSGVTNTQIKILGQTNQTKNINIILTGSSYNTIGNLSKSELKTQFIKNAYGIIKNGAGSTKVQFYTGDTTLNTWPTGKDTIIVNKGNLYLTSNITKDPGEVKTIVVLKNTKTTGGNIFIKNNIQSINAVLIAEGALISGEKNSPTDTYYADTNSGAVNQLYIYGSLFSNNTIGGSSQSTTTCPYDITSGCSLQVSKRYDLNHFRHYVNGVTGAKVPGLTGFDENPFIIKYDSDIALGKNKFLLTK